MIAAFCPLDLGAARWAKDDSINAFSEIELLLESVLTAREVAVPVFSATEANRVGAIWAAHFLCIHVASFHKSIAVWLGAESHKGISFQKAPISKQVEFLKYLRLIFFEDSF